MIISPRRCQKLSFCVTKLPSASRAGQRPPSGEQKGSERETTLGSLIPSVLACVLHFASILSTITLAEARCFAFPGDRH